MPDETCWTLVEDAAAGEDGARDAFARLYLPVVNAYLRARWAGNRLQDDVDDAAQEIFVDFMKPNGALARVRRDHGDGGFRAFLFGVARNVARRYEERAGRRAAKEAHLDSAYERQPAPDDSPSRAFDVAWARALMRAARERHAREAEQQDDGAIARVELLRLRFREGLPIRRIAERWGEEPAIVHRQYARARQEFAKALYETVALQSGGTPAAIRRECERLLSLLR